MLVFDARFYVLFYFTNGYMAFTMYEVRLRWIGKNFMRNDGDVEPQKNVDACRVVKLLGTTSAALCSLRLSRSAAEICSVMNASFSTG